jgi:hypothetical protein
MKFFLPRRRQCRDGDLAEEGEEKDREKLPKVEGLVCRHPLSGINIE